MASCRTVATAKTDACFNRKICSVTSGSALADKTMRRIPPNQKPPAQPPLSLDREQLLAMARIFAAAAVEELLREEQKPKDQVQEGNDNE